MNTLMRQLFFVIVTFLIANHGYSQCQDCSTSMNEADFCFTDSLFEGKCASFKEGEAKFIYKEGKKEYILASDESDEYNRDYWLSIVSNKKNKISAHDLLFLQAATSKWLEVKKLLGYEFTDSGLGIKVLKEGEGELPSRGQEVEVHYSGFLENGEKFDSSVDRGQTFTFPLGMGRVIKGWDEGVAKMKVGTKAILMIPANLAYGERGVGPIPPNATLFFEVELISIK